MMTGQQLYVAIGVPLISNALILGIVVAYINAKFQGVHHRFETQDAKFAALNTRFDDMRDLWWPELKRVEEVIDARMKHLEH